MKELQEIKKREQLKKKEETLTVSEALGGRVPKPLIASKAGEARRKELIKLDDEIQQKRRAVDASVEETINDARDTASRIKDDAQKDRDSAKNIKSEVVALRRRWKKNARKQKDRGKYLDDKDRQLTLQTKKLEGQTQQISQDQQKAENQLDITSSLLVDLGSLVLVAIDKVNSIAKLEGTIRGKVEDTLSEAKKLYNGVEKKERNLKAKREFLDKCNKELDIKAAQVADQVKSLKMVRKIPGVE